MRGNTNQRVVVGISRIRRANHVLVGDGAREIAIVDAMPLAAVKVIDLTWRQSSAGNETVALIFERKSGADKGSRSARGCAYGPNGQRLR